MRRQLKLHQSQVKWPEYSPVEYNKDRPDAHPQSHDHEVIPLDQKLVASFNQLKNGVNRVSYLGKTICS